ncbi:MAG: hypothetical protein DHS20C05_25110 [Hyphococcus sp.]|nr:MAG: hypothetical protein DHS20C05_25110 [Marinicaulis sp.]
MFQTIYPQLAVQLLLFSGAAAVLWSSILGVFMMIPHLNISAVTNATKWINFRQLLSAHLDWIMLAFMQGLAALMILAFDLSAPLWVVVGMIYGGWMNAFPYFLRAFGINAFVYGGGAIQKIANVLGSISVLVLICCWAALIMMSYEPLRAQF